MKDFFNNIVGIELFTTRACNMRCTYCYENKPKYSKFSKETADNIIELIKNHPNIKHLDLFGGESLLPEIKDDLLEFLKNVASVRTDFDMYITTNALESEKVLDVIDYVANTFDKVSLQISLDGSKQAQDVCRIDNYKKGTFDRVFQNTILLLDRYKNVLNVHINIHHVISLQNIDYLVDTVALDNKLLELYPELQISYNSEHSINTKPHDIRKLLEILDFLNELYLNRDLHPRLWDRFIHADEFFYETQPRCNLMDAGAIIDTNGDMCPCHFFSKKDKHDFYNINTKKFDQEKYDKAKAFATEVEVSSELNFDCSSCVSKGFCPYCAAASWLATDSKYAGLVGSTACSYARTIGEWAVRIYNDGIRTAADEETKSNMLIEYNRLADIVEADPSKENIRNLLFYRIKCKLNGLYEPEEV